ncbi:MAG: hypothetical protein BGO01_09540 [Armatimonadetes bacterium 55-13]|nr:beta-lactamase family protein [Armatimonadota bacterium]OJU62650.1 MAG: hypothetical protein BGO01_09540 [Armatimonadetes bacterium 55-13]
MNRSLLISLLTVAMGSAQADPVDDFVTSSMAAQKIPAVVIGIVKDGKLVRKQAYGKIDLELDVDAKPDDIYEIGSITKQFTAFATLLLAEQKKLSLNDSVDKYIDNCPEIWKPITIRHLLYQISGLPDYAFVPGLGIVGEFTKDQFLTTMAALPLDFKPGVTWAYSNTNYALLGWVIEKASGIPYPRFVEENIFKPAGMTQTFFGDNATIRPRRAHGYMNNQGEIIRAIAGAGSIASDGSINSTVEDMAKWDALLHEHRLLSAESYALMWSPAKLNSGRQRPYGTGWFLGDPSLPDYVGHGGNSSGYSAGFARYTKDGLSVIMLSNLYPVSGEQFCRTIAELLEPSLRAKIPEEKPDPQKERTQKIKAAVLTFAEGKQDSNCLEEEVLAPMRTQRAAMSPVWQTVRKLTELKFAGETKQGKDTLLTYRLLTPDRNFTAYILWSDHSKIAQMTLKADPPKA